MSEYDRRRFLQAGLPMAAAMGGLSCGKRSDAQPVAVGSVLPAAAPRLGINLTGIVDWNTELPFVDFFRQSREWISQREGAGWGQGPKLALDAAGWVKALEPECYADTPVCNEQGGRHPAGTYLVTYEGRGELTFWGSGRIVDSAPGRLSVSVKPTDGALWCRLRKTDPSNPVRNIRVLRPGFDADAPPNAFHADFLERWRGVSSVRFMDWMVTNDSIVARWGDRPLPTDASFMRKGVAIETMVELVNTLQADPWFCIPHLADDDFVRRFAELVKERLAPQIKVWLEYSNEVWNWQFQQARHVQGEASRLKIAPHAFMITRSTQIFRIWEQVFGGRNRLVRVLPAQAGNRYLTEQILRHPEVASSADVLAIAPYFGIDVAPSSDRGLAADEVERWPVDRLMDYLESKALPESIEVMRQQKTLADKAGLKLVAYEGGQHLRGVLGVESRETVTRLLHAANAHPRMGQLYERYLDAWVAAGGDLFCHFSSVANWTKWGSWGLLQHTAQDPKTSPKFMATMKWAQKMGQKVRVPA